MLIRRLAVNLVRSSKSRAISVPLRILALLSIRFFGSSLAARRIVDFSFPVAPIKTVGELPSIGLHVVAARKDFIWINEVIEMAVKNSLNPVDKVLVVVPDYQVDDLPKLSRPVTVIEESALLPEEIQQAIRANSPVGREGWITQQAAKLWSVHESSELGVLVVDSDTFLTFPRAFLDNEARQLLSISHEYHTPYEMHAKRSWGKRRIDRGLSYVTHHQLMQPDIVREMFNSAKDLATWIRSGDASLRSPIADYHCYGRFLRDNFPRRSHMARWGNVASASWQGKAETELGGDEETLTESHLSVSMHHYLRQ